MDVNYEYFLEYLKRFPNHKDLKVLDYGCGSSGKVVKLLRKNGINCHGMDVFCHQGSNSPILQDPLAKSGIIKPVSEEGDLPVPEKYFDVIISNQVFEHVKNMKSTMSRLGKALKDDGVMYHHFPSKEVIREGHIGIAFSHWFPRNSRIRYYYTLFWRYLGLGRHKDERSPRQWTIDMLNMIDTQCCYRKYSEIRAILSKDYTIRHKEIEYIIFRSSKIKPIHYLAKIRCLSKMYDYVFRRLGFMALELRKRI